METLEFIINNRNNQIKTKATILRVTATQIVIDYNDPHTLKAMKFRRSDGYLVGNRVSYWIDKTELARINSLYPV